MKKRKRMKKRNRQKNACKNYKSWRFSLCPQRREFYKLLRSFDLLLNREALEMLLGEIESNCNWIKKPANIPVADKPSFKPLTIGDDGAKSINLKLGTTNATLPISNKKELSFVIHYKELCSEFSHFGKVWSLTGIEVFYARKALFELFNSDIANPFSDEIVFKIDHSGVRKAEKEYPIKILRYINSEVRDLLTFQKKQHKVEEKEDRAFRIKSQRNKRKREKKRRREVKEKNAELLNLHRDHRERA